MTTVYPAPGPSPVTYQAIVQESADSSSLIEVTLSPAALAPEGTSALLLGLDFAISGTVSNTFICEADLNDCVFFANNQTFAEGRGGASWRGSIPFAVGDTLYLYLNVTAAVKLGIVGWGGFFVP